MKLVHVTIQTKKFKEEIEFFTKYAGLEVANRIEGAGKNIVFLTGSEGGSSVEIIENEEAENSGNEHISLGFKADDVEKKREELMADGYETTPLISPVPGTKFFFTKDPAGVTIQFI